VTFAAGTYLNYGIFLIFCLIKCI